MHLSPAASLQSAFPAPDRLTLPSFAVPDSFATPLEEIDTPDKLPRYLLLGERDDASFEPAPSGFSINYTWSAFGQGPVCRVEVADNRLDIIELWDGETVFHSFFAGKTLTEGLTYHFGATLANRDARRNSAEHDVATARLDPREPFFRQWFARELGINWQLPVPGIRLAVEQPAGILRALVLPSIPGDSRVLTDLVRQYQQRPGAWVVDGLDDRLRHGTFSRRRADVRWRRLDSDDEFEVEATECRVFVGAWRAVVELAQFLHEQGWPLIGDRLNAFACFPYNLVQPYRTQQGRLDDERSLTVDYPPLLPPQVGLGVTEGFVPESLGDLTPYRAGGPEEGQQVLRQAIDRAFPVHGGPTLFAMANPRAPTIWLQRPAAAEQVTVPVLCVLLDGKSLWNIAQIVHDASGKRLKLGHQVTAGEQSFFIAPNLPDETFCHDPEGFHYLLPDVVKRLETELEASWVVEDFVMSGVQQGKELSSCASAGPRQEGW